MMLLASFGVRSTTCYIRRCISCWRHQIWPSFCRGLIRFGLWISETLNGTTSRIDNSHQVSCNFSAMATDTDVLSTPCSNQLFLQRYNFLTLLPPIISSNKFPSKSHKFWSCQSSANQIPSVISVNMPFDECKAVFATFLTSWTTLVSALAYSEFPSTNITCFWGHIIEICPIIPLI